MTTQSLTNAKDFILAGNATFTILNETTGGRFTYKVVANKSESGPSHFVKLLTGSNNEADYTYLGCVWDSKTYSHGRKSSIGRDATSAKALTWAFPRIIGGKLPECVKVFHEGRCGRCGRKLTVPESIESGFGPECVRLMGGSPAPVKAKPAVKAPEHSLSDALAEINAQYGVCPDGCCGDERLTESQRAEWRSKQEGARRMYLKVA